jgi:predicted glutamine amidotransferase
LQAENALIKQSLVHQDGWGIGWYVDDDAYVVKSATPAHSCDRFRTASERLESETFIVHVRRATVGRSDHHNAHPFRYGRWIFAHNGTILGFNDLRNWMIERTTERLRELSLGETDSEALFYYLISSLERAGFDRTGRKPSNAHDAATTVRQCLADLRDKAEALGHPPPILNLVLTDGRIFVAHKAGMPLFLSTQKTSCAQFDTCSAIKVCMEAVRPAEEPVNHMLIASEPIGDDNIWEDLQDGSTVVLAQGFELELLPPPADWIAPQWPVAGYEECGATL